MNSEILDRLPPQNPDAEKSVLGSILLDPAVCSDVVTEVKSDDFYVDANRRLFANMVSMYDANERIDVMLLVARLKRSNDFERIGGAAYLAEVAQAVPVAAHAVYYAKIVRERAMRRRVIHAATDMIRSAWDDSSSIQDVVNQCEAQLQQIQTGEYEGEPVPMKTAIIDAMNLIDDIASRRRQAGIMVGLESFDREVGGVFPGELVVLAARPSVGKTSMALQFARYVASHGRLVYYASLEMGSTDLALRVLCGEAGVPMSIVRSGEISDGDVRAICNAANAVGESQVVIHSRAGLSAMDMRRACRRLKTKGLGMIVVDYLQRVTPEDRRIDRHLQVGQITWALKALALELQVPVLALSQLGRAAEERDRKTGLIMEPRLSHLKESGDIEQDADMVMLLHRQQRAKETTLILAKNRQGAQGKLNLMFDAARTRFTMPEVDNYSEFDGFSGD